MPDIWPNFQIIFFAENWDRELSYKKAKQPKMEKFRNKVKWKGGIFFFNKSRSFRNFSLKSETVWSEDPTHFLLQVQNV